MTIEERIKNLESRLNNLQNAFLQAQKNQVPITAKTDNNAVKVDAVTPFISTKTAFIDDTEVIFENVPQGNYTVYMTDTDGQNVPYTSERINGNIKVSFEKRTSLATVTISIL